VLTIVNSAGASSTTPGSVVRFTSTFTNSGQVAYTGITVASNITNVVDDATPNGDQTATSGTLSLTATGISWTGNIPVGGTVTITGTVTVNNPDNGNKVLASTITTTAAGSNCPSGGNDPRCSVSVPVLIPALTITATANTSTAAPGTDTLNLLGDATYNNNAAATSGTASYASPVITWTGDLAVGAAAIITYTVTVNNPDTGGKSLATVAANNDAAAVRTGTTTPPGTVTTARPAAPTPVVPSPLTYRHWRS
jgi:hypothetical protein